MPKDVIYYKRLTALLETDGRGPRVLVNFYFGGKLNDEASGALGEMGFRVGSCQLVNLVENTLQEEPRWGRCNPCRACGVAGVDS